MLLVHAPPAVCARRLLAGQVKRVMPTGPTCVGYWLCCPACERVGFYSSARMAVTGIAESAEWTRTAGHFPLKEADDDPTHATVEHPVSLRGQVTCGGCGRALVLSGQEIEAHGGGTWAGVAPAPSVPMVSP